MLNAIENIMITRLFKESSAVIFKVEKYSTRIFCYDRLEYIYMKQHEFCSYFCINVSSAFSVFSNNCAAT